MEDKTALTLGTLGVGLFGASLADLGQIATIFAGFMGGFASLAAGIYYVWKMKRDK